VEIEVPVVELGKALGRIVGVLVRDVAGADGILVAEDIDATAL
jgi:hypothetical protein